MASTPLETGNPLLARLTAKMRPRVLFSDGAGPRESPEREELSRTVVAKTPAAIRVRFLTKQLANHREEIRKLEKRNSDLETELASRSGEGDVRPPAVAVLEAQLLAAREGEREWRARAEAAEDEVRRLRIERGRKASPSAGALTSPLTPTDEFEAVLESLREMGRAEAQAQAEPPDASADDGFFDAMGGAAPPLDADDSGDADAGEKGKSSWAVVAVHPLVAEAAHHCRTGK